MKRDGSKLLSDTDSLLVPYQLQSGIPHSPNAYPRVISGKR